MTDDRRLQEIVARCVSAMVYYHNSERSSKADEHMVAEVQVIAGFVEESGLEMSQIDDRINKPVQHELFVRYGHELGPRLFGEFIRAFESLKDIEVDVVARKDRRADRR